MVNKLSVGSFWHRARAAVHNARWRTPTVPRLQVSMSNKSTGTAWFITPDWNRPSGGIRKQYRSVDVLNASGIAAAIVHHSRGFRCDWFINQTHIVAAPDITVSSSDVIVVPEIYGSSICDLPTGIRQVILNQNAYITLDSILSGIPNSDAPYLANPDLVAVAAVSAQNAKLLSYMFKGVLVHRIRWALDPAVYFPPQAQPGRRIAFMPRRRSKEAAHLLSLLRFRDALKGWEIVEIAGCSEWDAAELMRSCRVFLSLGEREGLGLPPLEAIACGCLVVGFTGYAGAEFFQLPYATQIEDGDIGAFAPAVEELMRWTEKDPLAAKHAALNGSRHVLHVYSPEAEQLDLADFFRPLLT